LQYPYIKKSYVESLLDYIDYVKPDSLLCVGDELDAQTISTYARGTALEFEGSLQKNIIGLKGLLKEFRSAIGRSKPFQISRSNHTARIERYIAKFAPGFSCIDSIKIENLLGYNDKDINVKYNRSLTEVAKGVLLGHGDEGRLYSQAGATALGLALRTGKSVICGHTHRAGLMHQSFGYSAKLSKVFGMEVGHLCDLSSPGMKYTKGYANWQAGFGILYEQNGQVKPELVTFNKDGSFIADGELWR
jgi:hypothetical protein